MVNQLVLNTATIGLVISIIGFEIGVFLRDRYKWPIFNPLLVAIIFVIIVLNVFNIDYDSYYASADNLSYLLTPATVCLAIPLYQQIEQLKKHKGAIFAGISAGVLTSLMHGLGVIIAFPINARRIRNLIAKINYDCHWNGLVSRVRWICDDYRSGDYSYRGSRKYVL